LQPSITSGDFDDADIERPFRRIQSRTSRSLSLAAAFDGRHTIDEKGRRVLVGLSAEETREFETLDSLSPSDASGNRIAWTFGGDPTHQPRKALARASIPGTTKPGRP